MVLGTWLEKRDAAYVGLVAASLVGVAILVSYTVMAILSVSLEPIDPAVVAALTIILAVIAGEHAKSSGTDPRV